MMMIYTRECVCVSHVARANEGFQVRSRRRCAAKVIIAKARKFSDARENLNVCCWFLMREYRCDNWLLSVG